MESRARKFVFNVQIFGADPDAHARMNLFPDFNSAFGELGFILAKPGQFLRTQLMLFGGASE